MKIAVCGAAGFIGGHLAKRLVADGHDVVAADIRPIAIDRVRRHQIDFRIAGDCREFFEQEFDRVYQLAADMGGIEYICDSDNDFNIHSNSSLININILNSLRHSGTRVFYASSACVYPLEPQSRREDCNLTEALAYPANPDTEYGWQKLYCERLYESFQKSGLGQVRIARFHNIFGPGGVWRGGREKAPAAICRKVAAASDGDCIEVFGSGEQVRSFLYIDPCVEGMIKLMESQISYPINIGSSRAVTIKDLAEQIINISGKRLGVTQVRGPTGVPYRNSNNTLIESALNWRPSCDLDWGLRQTYEWVNAQMRAEAAICTRPAAIRLT